MASTSKRGAYQYHARVRRKGYPTQTRTFGSMRDAEDRAATVDSEMRRGLVIDRSESERTTSGEAVSLTWEQIACTTASAVSS